MLPALSDVDVEFPVSSFIFPEADLELEVDIEISPLLPLILEPD